MRQTLLTEVDRLEFDEPVHSLHLATSGAASALLAGMANGAQLARTIPSPYVPGAVSPPPGGDISAVEEPARKGIVAWRGKKRRFTLLSEGAGRADLLAEYSARSSYDLAAARKDLFAQVSADGLRVTLFQKGVPMLFGTHDWEDRLE